MRLMMAAGVAAIGLLAVLGIGSMASGKERGAPPQVKATGTVDSAQITDVAPNGDSPGDTLVFTQRMTDSRGRQIGTANAYCVRTVVGEARQCQGTFDLPRGQVFVVGPDPEYSKVKVHPLAIVGGTRAYRDVRGDVVLTHLSEVKDRDVFTFVR